MACSHFAYSHTEISIFFSYHGQADGKKDNVDSEEHEQN